MSKKTELQDVGLDWIYGLDTETIFRPADLYCFLQKKYPSKCEERGDSAYEKRYKNDARWAVKRALRNGLTSHIAHGRYQRIR